VILDKIIYKFWIINSSQYSKCAISLQNLHFMPFNTNHSYLRQFRRNNGNLLNFIIFLLIHSKKEDTRTLLNELRCISEKSHEWGNMEIRMNEATSLKLSSLWEWRKILWIIVDDSIKWCHFRDISLIAKLCSFFCGSELVKGEEGRCWNLFLEFCWNWDWHRRSEWKDRIIWV